MAEKRLLKELKLLAKEKPNPQILLLEPDAENIFTWRATIAKPSLNESAYYYNGQWDLNIELSPQYPIQPPKISFAKKTPIAHPNIDINSGEICLDILKLSSWSPAWNIHYLVVAILVLIDDPEPDSPLNIDMANLYRYDKVAYRSFCQYTIWKHRTSGEVLDRSGVKNAKEHLVTPEEEGEEEEEKPEATAEPFEEPFEEPLEEPLKVESTEDEEPREQDYYPTEVTAQKEDPIEDIVRDTSTIGVLSLSGGDSLADSKSAHSSVSDMSSGSAVTEHSKPSLQEKLKKSMSLNRKSSRKLLSKESGDEPKEKKFFSRKKKN